jgi:hypothetical protein
VSPSHFCSALRLRDHDDRYQGFHESSRQKVFSLKNNMTHLSIPRFQKQASDRFRRLLKKQEENNNNHGHFMEEERLSTQKNHRKHRKLQCHHV